MKWEATMAAGFTLMEVLVVVLIIGVLAGIAVPRWVGVAEASKATIGASMAMRISAANRMYRLQRGAYTTGLINNACNSQTTCPASGGVADPCSLVSCGLVAREKFDAHPYVLYSAAAAACAGACAGSANVTACACRRTSGAGSTSQAPYNAWGYTVTAVGVTAAVGAAPAPSQ